MGSSKKQTVGYKYYLGMHMILCHGPIDKITRITVDNKTAWSGNTAGGEFRVTAQSLFGERDLKGPNVVWYGDFRSVPIKKKGGKK